MIKLEYVCKKISNYIAKDLNLDDDRRSVINYGLISFVQVAICIALVIIFGFIFNVVIEALIISFTISILRKSSGGVHATSPGRCAIIGTINSIVLGLVAKHTSVSLGLIIFAGSVVFLWSYFTVYKLAPVDSIEKPIKSLKKRTRLKKSSMMILNVYLIIIVIEILYFNFIRNHIVLVYSLCIYMGILWQVFSLTKYGHSMMIKLDEFLNNI